MIERADITGLVLCGGRGSRMGGLDKGLQPWHGEPLALHALGRLAPQVGRCAINANRNLERYAAWGVPVWPDASADRPGPLAGFLAGLGRCETEWLLTVPCDAPRYPRDLAERLARTVESAGAPLAIARTGGAGGGRAQPVFCLMRRGLGASLGRFLRQGGRKVEHWSSQHGAAEALFDEAEAFANANTLAELRELETSDG